MDIIARGVWRRADRGCGWKDGRRSRRTWRGASARLPATPNIGLQHSSWHGNRHCHCAPRAPACTPHCLSLLCLYLTCVCLRPLPRASSCRLFRTHREGGAAVASPHSARRLFLFATYLLQTPLKPDSVPSAFVCKAWWNLPTSYLGVWPRPLHSWCDKIVYCG